MLISKLRRFFEPEASAEQQHAPSRGNQHAGNLHHPTPSRLPLNTPDHNAHGVVSARSTPYVTLTPSKKESDQEEANEYLARVQKKINKIAEEFASGMINREQFQELYDHYQQEIRTIETWMELAPDTESWRGVCSEGKSVVIRRQHMARILGYAIYQNESGMPIATIGKFEVDPALYVPMLSSYRSAAREIFGAGMRSSQIENGRWLCFVPGERTTLMALFSIEPADKQLKSLNQIHKLFEQANRHILDHPVIDPNALVLPHQSFVGHRR